MDNLPKSYLLQKAEDSENVVFKETVVKDGNKNILSYDSSGIMTNFLYQRSARPYTWSGSNERYIYDSNTSVQFFPDGTMKSTRTISRNINPNYGVNTQSEYGIPTIEPELSDLISSNQVEADSNEEISLIIKLRNVPQYNIPLNPPEGVLSTHEMSLYSSKRDEALTLRENNISILATNLISFIETNKGTVDDINYLTGWVSVTIPVSSLSSLANRTDIKKITTNHTNIENGCNSTCNENTYGTSSGYHDQFILGESRRSDFIDADRFIDAGYDADGLIASDMELNEYWDELCYLSKVADCHTESNFSRMKYKYQYCSQSGSCTPVTNFDEADCSDDSHGIMVTSILAGDFRNLQARPYEYFDPCWNSGTTGHCSNWQNNSTGIAPRANLAAFAHAGGNEKTAGSILASISSTYGIDADVINITLSQKANQCDPYDSPVDSDAIETAYDEGAFVVVASGNGDNSSNTTCIVQNPGDTPKAFTVASVNTLHTSYVPNTTCLSGNYEDCMQLYKESRRGGAEAKTVAGNFPGELSVIDLIAPGCVSYRSSCDAPPDIIGKVYPDTDQLQCGSSIATPIVSGAALLVKHWLIALGVTDIYSPGVLYTVMLAMGDRFSEATGSQAETGGDPWSGFGRLKLRLLSNNYFGPGSFNIDRKTFSTNNTETHEYFPFSAPVPATAQILKCVSHNSENVSSWSKLAYTTLELKAYEPKVTYLPPPYPHIPQYYCDYGTNTTGATLSDNSHDTKHIVAFDSTTTSVNISQFHGKCVKVIETGRTPRKGNWLWGYTYKSVTTNTFCYYASVSDNQ